ncbi:hypothetical protein TNCV_1315491 [Trichonephila clavipes]|uniref:Transposase n=1 Tax=Trichonephila clavipes TaxID=2585209 RepID=A0A8X6VPE9_TRICX|nr:hypothetical protein TNCV_1315491 [Trichonephila clavipes]
MKGSVGRGWAPKVSDYRPKHSQNFDSVPSHINGQTINQHNYLEILKRVCEKFRKKGPELGSDGSLLHQDDASTHVALTVKHFQTSKNITLTEHPAYSSDLAP